MRLVVLKTENLSDMLRDAGNQGCRYVWILSESELGLGPEPSRLTHSIELGAEKLKNHREPKRDPPPPPPPPPSLSQKLHRSDKYSVTIFGAETGFPSLKDLLKHTLIELERYRPGTLDKLTRIKPRSKRIVARSPSDLFNDPALSEQYSEHLCKDWWFGTNNSSQETMAWLKRAVDQAGLVWGKDVSVRL